MTTKSHKNVSLCWALCCLEKEFLWCCRNTVCCSITRKYIFYFLLLFLLLSGFHQIVNYLKWKMMILDFYSSVCEEVNVGSDLRYNEDYEGMWICLEIFYIDENWIKLAYVTLRRQFSQISIKWCSLGSGKLFVVEFGSLGSDEAHWCQMRLFVVA